MKLLLLAPLALLVPPAVPAPAAAETLAIKVSGVELGERLSKPRAQPALEKAPQVTPVSDAEALPQRAERKVRVVYPLPR